MQKQKLMQSVQYNLHFPRHHCHQHSESIKCVVVHTVNKKKTNLNTYSHRHTHAQKHIKNTTKNNKHKIH